MNRHIRMNKQITRMKQLIIALFTTILFLSVGTETKAQSYKNAIGVRLGACNGLTFKTWLAESRAVDLSLNYIYGSEYSTYCLTGLYEVHMNTNILPHLLWYYGGGGSLGSKRHKNVDNGKLFISIDGVIGLDYKFEKEPINLSLDWKPAVQFAPLALFDGGGLNLSIRYTF